MADEVDPATPGRTRLFNGSTQPRVVTWGEGVVMPGESFETDSPEGYAPDTPGSPWTTDAEASSALLSAADASAGDTSESGADSHSEAQDAPQQPSRGAWPRAVNTTGDGHEVTPIEPAPITQAANPKES